MHPALRTVGQHSRLLYGCKGAQRARGIVRENGSGQVVRLASVVPMPRRPPFRYFKTSPEIVRFAVMLYIHCHCCCRCGKRRIYFTSEGSTSATRLCGSSGTGLGRLSQLGPAGNLPLKSLFIKLNALLPREGSTAVAFPPPLALTKVFSRSGRGWIFPLFSGVMRARLSTGSGTRWSGSGLSGPIFSGPVAFADLVNSF